MGASHKDTADSADIADGADIADRVAAAQLEILGGFHPDASEGIGATLLLLGPREPGFWARFTDSPEYRDAQAHPLDRWSLRVISALAAEIGAEARFPFGGPPYQPFIAWALRSGDAWQSPAGPLVHARAGMLVSYRGALALPQQIPLPEPGASPCTRCAARPCLTACPVGALSAASGYDLSACHAHLDTAPDCMAAGCLARRACPVSQTYARLPTQSAFHMKAFHP